MRLGFFEDSKSSALHLQGVPGISFCDAGVVRLTPHRRGILSAGCFEVDTSSAVHSDCVLAMSFGENVVKRSIRLQSHGNMDENMLFSSTPIIRSGCGIF